MVRELEACPKCGAALPGGTDAVGDVMCPYCGAISRRAGTTRELVRAAVREVLLEDLNGNGIPDVLEQRPRRVPAGKNANAGALVVVVIFGAALALGVLGLVVGLLTSKRRAPSHTVSMAPLFPAQVVPPVPPTPPRPPPPPGPAKPVAPRGTGGAVALDEAGDVLAQLGATVVKADARTLELKWQRAVVGASSGEVLLPRHARIALATGSGVFFLDSATGEVVKKWSYNGILERSCASGADELMLEVLGAGTMFFDAKTGTKVDWASHCRLKEKIGCPAEQSCRWSGQPCRYTVTVGKTTYRSCEVDDGQGTRQLVASGAVTWKVAGEADSYFGVVSGVLIAASSQRLLALNPQTGATVWSLAGRIGSGLAVANGALYLTLDDELISVDVKTGQSLARLHLADASR